MPSDEPIEPCRISQKCRVVTHSTFTIFGAEDVTWNIFELFCMRKGCDKKLADYMGPNFYPSRRLKTWQVCVNCPYSKFGPNVFFSENGSYIQKLSENQFFEDIHYRRTWARKSWLFLIISLSCRMSCLKRASVIILCESHTIERY